MRLPGHLPVACQDNCGFIALYEVLLSGRFEHARHKEGHSRFEGRASCSRRIVKSPGILFFEENDLNRHLPANLVYFL